MVRREHKSPADKSVDNRGKSGGNAIWRCVQPEKPALPLGQKKAARGAALMRSAISAQAVSPYTVTVMSTITSVCSATLTAWSPTVFRCPAGMRICAFATVKPSFANS